ncbi:VacJ family lipoprotein [Sphingomonas sp. AP4-R1]|uniref:MlaA family lipoprotein n=1 Tax=Sphingomonas sp. AP4-R1 TaxID=2735134 RepID=UPI00149375CC|nr:VacJ family lipoprotein [Sphingomonas sp. AP4-R1]QJU57519.1 VacJ family lipoprotein [Sphingomonas sp. AP4-R1]
MIALLLAAAQAPAAPSIDVVGARSPAHVRHAPGDPLEGFNRRMYKVYDGLDHGVVRPAAMGYKKIVPRFLRTALRNVFSNLNEPVVFVNYVLQLKIGKAAETTARFVVNSTIGLAGTVDVARDRKINLPHRPNGFGDTLGFYGVKPGPYIFLPILGPTTLRDLLGAGADGLVLPTAVGKPFNRIYYQIPRAVIGGLDMRAEYDSDLKALLNSALDPYATMRSVYLQDRAGEIAGLKGKSIDGDGMGLASGGAGSGDPLADPLADPMADPAAAPGATPAMPGTTPMLEAPMPLLPAPPAPKAD